MGLNKWVKKRILITVKTYPIPSYFHQEIVCTTGIEEDGGFIRLYPINFRYMERNKQYKKYDWIEVECEKSKDPRKESYKPNLKSIKIVGHIPVKQGNWDERVKYILRPHLLSKSLEALEEQRKIDKTSLGLIKPKEITDFLIEKAEEEWPDKMKRVFQQQILIGPKQKHLTKIPFKFSYIFSCDDSRCKKNHKIMIEDWEVGACYLNALQSSSSPQEAAQKVRKRFFDQICSPDRDTHFYLGTHLLHPHTWIIIGLFYPKKKKQMGLWQSTPDR